MHYAMSKDILEVHKSKKYYMLIFDLKMFIPFVNGVKLRKFWLGTNWKRFNAYFVFFCVEKLKGGLRRLILVACNLDRLQQKVKNSVFLIAALHGENGFKVWKMEFVIIFLSIFIVKEYFLFTKSSKKCV